MQIDDKSYMAGVAIGRELGWYQGQESKDEGITSYREFLRWVGNDGVTGESMWNRTVNANLGKPSGASWVYPQDLRYSHIGRLIREIAKHGDIHRAGCPVVFEDDEVRDGDAS